MSPILAGGLDVLLLLTFSIECERIFKLKRDFAKDLYDDNYTGEYDEDESKSNERKFEVFL